MGLFDIVLKHLWRNKSKALFLALGIIIGVTTIVSLYTITISMEKEVSDKFDQIGSNIIIVPKTEELPLAYGGITVSTGGQSEVSLPEEAIN
ncbi:MAG: ABC transporter permease, partial [Clostridia bacterium]|nr:ABC transporter permease [Clostridia bacterium]